MRPEYSKPSIAIVMNMPERQLLLHGDEFKLFAQCQCSIATFHSIHPNAHFENIQTANTHNFNVMVNFFIYLKYNLTHLPWQDGWLGGTLLHWQHYLSSIEVLGQLIWDLLYWHGLTSQYAEYSVVWNYLSIPKLPHCTVEIRERKSILIPCFEMDVNYLSMLGWNIMHVSKRGPWMDTVRREMYCVWIAGIKLYPNCQNW